MKANLYARVLSARILRSALVLVLVGLFTGCQAPYADPFNKFSGAVSALANNTDVVIEVENSKTRDEYPDRVLSELKRTGGDRQLSRKQLLLNPEPADLRFAGPEQLALFVVMQRARAALTDLNDAVAMYAAGIADLAGGKDFSDETFDKMLADIDGHIKDYQDTVNTLAASNPDFKPLELDVSERDRGLISGAVAELFRQYIRGKQAAALQKALDAAQPNIRKYSDHAKILVKVLGQRVATRYTTEVNAAFEELAAANASDDAVRGAVRAIMATNDQSVAAMQTLRTLHAAYDKLPQAHADLAKAAGGVIELRNVDALYSEAMRLYRHYKEVTKKEQTKE